MDRFSTACLFRGIVLNVTFNNISVTLFIYYKHTSKSLLHDHII